jgi:hypothetical protein
MFNSKFKATIGNERVNVVIMAPEGMDGAYYMVFIENYCHGSIIKCNNQWIRLHANKLELTVDDVQALGERIDEELKRVN